MHREGQAAAFVNEGKLADVYPPGMYTLQTQNMPILTMLKSWPHGFNSPFKAEVYFVSTRQFTDLKWGTANPIPMRDTDFGVVRVRAFGLVQEELPIAIALASSTGGPAPRCLRGTCWTTSGRSPSGGPSSPTPSSARSTSWRSGC